MSHVFAVVCHDALLKASKDGSKASVVTICRSAGVAREVLVDANSACQFDHSIVVMDFPDVERSLVLTDMLVAIMPLTEAQEAALTREQFELYRSIAETIDSKT